jgi:hypothetical protein
VLTSGVIGRDGSIAEYQEKIRQGYFSVVVINLQGSQAAFNAKLLPVVQSSGRYRLAATTSYWRSEIWVGRNRKITRYTGLAEPVPPLQGLLAPAARLNSVLGSISGVVVGSGAAVAILTLIIRLFWRRGKASGEV